MIWLDNENMIKSTDMIASITPLHEQLPQRIGSDAAMVSIDRTKTEVTLTDGKQIIIDAPVTSVKKRLN